MTYEGNKPGPKGPSKFTAEAQALFLEHYAKTSRKLESARKVGMTLQGVDLHARKHPEFVVRVEEAMQEYRELIGAEVKRRGHEGWDEPRFDKNGEECGSIRRHSDKLLVMEARRVDKGYRERVEVDANVTGKLDIVDLASLPEDARKKLRDVAVALARDRLAAMNGATTNGTASDAEDDGDEQS